jgi:hypothetical protein
VHHGLNTTHGSSQRGQVAHISAECAQAALQFGRTVRPGPQLGDDWQISLGERTDEHSTDSPSGASDQNLTGLI